MLQSTMNSHKNPPEAVKRHTKTPQMRQGGDVGCAAMSFAAKKSVAMQRCRDTHQRRNAVKTTCLCAQFTVKIHCEDAFFFTWLQRAQSGLSFGTGPSIPRRVLRGGAWVRTFVSQRPSKRCRFHSLTLTSLHIDVYCLCLQRNALFRGVCLLPTFTAQCSVSQYNVQFRGVCFLLVFTG